MAGWGRNAGPMPDTTGRGRRFGLWSVLCAAIALGLVIAAITVFGVMQEKEVSETASDAATFALVAVYVFVAPVLHIIGVVLGFTAIFRRDDSRALGIVGVLVNIVLVLIGAGLVYAALEGLTAFT